MFQEAPQEDVDQLKCTKKNKNPFTKDIESFIYEKSRFGFFSCFSKQKKNLRGIQQQAFNMKKLSQRKGNNLLFMSKMGREQM